MTEAAPTIHPIKSDSDGDRLVGKLTRRERDRVQAGVHVVVHVRANGNVAYGRIVDDQSAGHEAQRWIEHARRGSSPGGWSEQHHPRAEEHVGAWKLRNAAALDRLLIQRSRRAWTLEHEAPYIVEYAPLDTTALGIDRG